MNLVWLVVLFVLVGCSSPPACQDCLVEEHNTTTYKWGDCIVGNETKTLYGLSIDRAKEISEKYNCSWVE